MSESKHTPGPWNWETPCVNTHNGLFNAYVIDATGRKIGTMYGRGEEKYANAQLIATAPEMLALLEDIATGDAYGSIWQEQARAVVAKATGTQTRDISGEKR